MNDYEKITQFNIVINRETVFRLIDCYQDSPIYHDIIEEYIKLEKQVCQSIQPVVYIKFGILPDELATNVVIGGTPVIYVLMTLGNKVTELGETYFAQGDYLLGMLVNAMADTYLFQLDDILQIIIREKCASRHLGIAMRLEAPETLPMSAQKCIFDELNKCEELPMKITNGFMFTTMKTMSHILVLSKDDSVFHTQHDCSICSVVNCKLRSEVMN